MIVFHFTIIITKLSLMLAIPVPQSEQGQPVAIPTTQWKNLSWLVNGIPKSGLVGAADILGAGLANFGNGQGAAFNAIISAIFIAVGNLISGILGSGAVNTAFLNYNNRPPVDERQSAASGLPSGNDGDSVPPEGVEE